MPFLVAFEKDNAERRSSPASLLRDMPNERVKISMLETMKYLGEEWESKSRCWDVIGKGLKA